MKATRRCRLTYVVNSLAAGGAERLVVEMASALSAEFDISVVCLDEPGSWAGKLREAGVPVSCLWRQPGLDLAVAVRLAAHNRRFGTDIVHAHQTTAWFYSALARLFYHAPKLLFQEHGRFFPEADKPLKRLVNHHVVRRLTDRTVAVSQEIRARLVRYEGLKPDEVEVIYNGVQATAPLPAHDRARMRGTFGFRPDDFVVGTIGRFDPIKNLPMLVSALQSAALKEPRLRGLLVGDGQDVSRIKEYLLAGGMDGWIRMPGHREDARLVTQCLDLFVLSSVSEGTSMALLEAIASGVPVAVTGVGGNLEVVQEGLTGWIVPTGDSAALAEAISVAASDPVTRSRYAAAGRSRLAERFGFDGMMSAYRRLYAGLSC